MQYWSHCIFDHDSGYTFARKMLYQFSLHADILWLKRRCLGAIRTEVLCEPNIENTQIKEGDLVAIRTKDLFKSQNYSNITHGHNTTYVLRSKLGGSVQKKNPNTTSYYCLLIIRSAATLLTIVKTHNVEDGTFSAKIPTKGETNWLFVQK